jgi:hypothetical protein
MFNWYCTPLPLTGSFGGQEEEIETKVVVRMLETHRLEYSLSD